MTARLTQRPTVRPATKADASSLAELGHLASEGLAYYLWSKMAADGEDPWSVGRGRICRETGSFSYRNATVAEIDGQVAACLIGYALPETPEPIDFANMPAMFVPLQELENEAPGTWYVNVLATFPDWRNLGLGRTLLDHAEQLAKAQSIRRGMSVIVADNNPEARRLYERTGYRFETERAMIKNGWQSAGTAWQLLLKPF